MRRSQSYNVNICRDGDPPLIIAIDLQPMAPIEGVIQVQGDITNARTAEVVKILDDLLLMKFYLILTARNYLASCLEPEGDRSCFY